MLQIAMQGDEGFMAHLRMNPATVKRFSLLEPTRICVTNLYSAERRRVERFIERHFRKSYGAEIKQHYPMLMSVHDEEDNILAALGFRYSKDEKLFLEQYLDDAIEKVLSTAFGKDVPRNIIVETGNLVSSGKGASIFLFTALNAYLGQQGMQINIVTATDFLHRYFRTLGFKSTELAKAEQSRLSDGGKSWGSYYQENPRVIAGMIEQVLASLHGHLQVVLETAPADMHAVLHTNLGSREIRSV